MSTTTHSLAPAAAPAASAGRAVAGLVDWVAGLLPLGAPAQLVERTVLSGPQGGAWLRAAQLAGPQDDALPVLSIVVPACNDAPLLRMFLRTLESAMAGQQVCRWCVVFVDNGSSDNTWATVRALAARHAHVRGLRLARRVRSKHAVRLALADSDCADACLVLDASRPQTPAVVATVLDTWLQGGIDGLRSAGTREAPGVRLQLRAAATGRTDRLA